MILKDNKKAIELLSRFINHCNITPECDLCSLYDAEVCVVEYINRVKGLCTEDKEVLIEEITALNKQCVAGMCNTCTEEGALLYQLERCTANRLIHKIRKDTVIVEEPIKDITEDEKVLIKHMVAKQITELILLRDEMGVDTQKEIDICLSIADKMNIKL